MGFFDKLKKGLSKTKNSFEEKINNVFSTFRKVDEDLLDELEEVLTNLEGVGILVIDNNVYNLLPEKFDKLEKKRIPLLLKVD